MERKLIVMRHAKSSWDSPANRDHDRPLNDRGRRSATLMAKHLQALGWEPQHVLSSDALRTRETAALLLQEWEEGIEANFVPGLYLAGPSELESELHAISDEVEVLLVLGHNPGWERVAYQLRGQSITMKTATAVMLEAEHCESWGDVFRTEWKLHAVANPREL